jgi:hypothetical protein
MTCEPQDSLNTPVKCIQVNSVHMQYSGKACIVKKTATNFVTENNPHQHYHVKKKTSLIGKILKDRLLAGKCTT